MSSFKASSCLPNPVCQSRQLTISPNDYNNTTKFVPILEYNGNATQAPFTIDSGSIGPGPEGVLLQLKTAQQAKISTTDYLMYGYVEATLRHNARQGLVAAFITMSAIKDEIDWEFTTNSSSTAKTNYFWMGNAVTTHGTDLNPPNFNVSDWHTYGLNWTSSQLEWTIDGQVVRTLTRDQAGSSYPRSPSQIQFSTWAGGNATNPEGTIEWAGGQIDWNTPEYEKQGFYSQEIKQFNVQCASPNNLNLNTVAGNSSGTITSYVYTGANSSQTGEPVFGLSTEPLRLLSDPGADGYPGYPGYGMTLGSKNGSSGSISSSSALKFAVPIAGALVGLGAAWAIVAFVKRRRLKAPAISGIGVTGVNDDRFSGPKGGYAKAATSLHALPYQDPEHEQTNLYRNEPNMNRMVGGGIMSDAGVSHLQRQTTGSSKTSQISGRSMADRFMPNQSSRQYQQLDPTAEEEAVDQMSGRAYQSPAYVPARGQQGDSYAMQSYGRSYDQGAYGHGGVNSYYPGQVASPAARQQQVPTAAPYTPNYAPAPQRPSGRMYDTPNVNYYPTPVIQQQQHYQYQAPYAPQNQHAYGYHQQQQQQPPRW